MHFFEAAANWADRSAVDVKFARDEYDGWFAILSYTDARGPYSAVVNEVRPVKGEDFQSKVDKMMSTASARAHRTRIRAIKFAKAA